jgi:hypothetical protein
MASAWSIALFDAIGPLAVGCKSAQFTFTTQAPTADSIAFGGWP